MSQILGNFVRLEVFSRPLTSPKVPSQLRFDILLRNFTYICPFIGFPHLLPSDPHVLRLVEREKTP